MEERVCIGCSRSSKCECDGVWFATPAFADDDHASAVCTRSTRCIPTTSTTASSTDGTYDAATDAPSTTTDAPPDTFTFALSLPRHGTSTPAPDVDLAHRNGDGESAATLDPECARDRTGARPGYVAVWRCSTATTRRKWGESKSTACICEQQNVAFTHYSPVVVQNGASFVALISFWAHKIWFL